MLYLLSVTLSILDLMKLDVFMTHIGLVLF